MSARAGDINPIYDTRPIVPMPDYLDSFALGHVRLGAREAEAEIVVSPRADGGACLVDVFLDPAVMQPMSGDRAFLRAVRRELHKLGLPTMSLAWADPAAQDQHIAAFEADEDLAQAVLRLMRRAIHTRAGLAARAALTRSSWRSKIELGGSAESRKTIRAAFSRNASSVMWGNMQNANAQTRRRRLMALTVFVVTSVVLVGCTSAEGLIAQDEAQCRSYGFEEGTRTFRDCKLMLAHTRYLDAQARAERAEEIGRAMQLSDLERRQRQLEYQQRWLEQQQRNLHGCIENRRTNPRLTC